ncbi:MAG: PHP domain-containing protein [Armatimonadota bacterium]
MRSLSYLLSCSLLIFAWFCASAAEFTAFRQIYVAPHLHTRFSDGAERMSRVVEMARDAGFQAAWLTDHADMYWKYPVLGTTVGYYRRSLWNAGFDEYLRACRRVQQRYPEMILIPGFEASPYYYFTGSLLGKELVVHQWQKHLIVAGIEDEKTFRSLPMLAYHSSPRPRFTDEGEAPYIRFTEAVRAAGGVAFWAHPYGSEKARMTRNIYAEVTEYTGSLLTVPAAHGMAVRGVSDVVTTPGGLWDRALAAYCAGERATPPGVMVENDYHRGQFSRRPTLVLLIPVEADADRAACLDALRAGRYYVTNAQPGKLALADFTLASPDGRSAVPGETLHGDGPFTISYSLTGENPIQWVRLIRNGTVVFQRTEPTGTWTEQELPAAPGYYRLAVQDARGQFLLSQPIFYRAGGS